MEIIICPRAQAATKLAATIIVDTIVANPFAVLGLATGRTMESLYQQLIELCSTRAVSCKGITSFNLDEYIGIPAADRHSYRSYMEEHLFSKIDIERAHTHLPNGVANDLEAECARYESTITRAGGIDLQLLGLGLSGHIGFNEPLSALRSRTRAKSLAPETIAQNRALFPPDSTMPSRAITMGVGTILEARRCLLVVTGKSKAEILAKAIEGPVTSLVSASALQFHPRCTVVVDELSAAKLTHRDYYRWIFENEPEWAPYRSIVSEQ